MKLNVDCIRDLLLYFEENLDPNDSYQMEFNELPSYSSQDIYYCTIQLLDAGFIDGKNHAIKSSFPLIIVNRITWNGHEFLDNIRPKTIWDKTKNIGQELKTNSIDSLFKISSAVITEIIKHNLGYI